MVKQSGGDHDPFNWRGRDCSFEGPIDEDGVQVSSGLDTRGRELPDPVPMSPPVGMSQGPSLADFVQRMIRQEVSRHAAAQDMESFEEAEDFDIEDDPLDPLTEYEKTHDVKVPEDWPMYYNPETGFHGQLPPNTRPPEGFVQLQREKTLPKGYSLPDLVEAGGKGGAEPPPGVPPSGRPKSAKSKREAPQTDTDTLT